MEMQQLLQKKQMMHSQQRPRRNTIIAKHMEMSILDPFLWLVALKRDGQSFRMAMPWKDLKNTPFDPRYIGGSATLHITFWN